MLFDHRDQQIVRRKTRNLKSCLGTSVGTNQAKFEKNSIYRAILLGFLCSLVTAIRSKANKSILRREERPIGSRSLKMLRDLRLRTRGLTQHVAAANASTEVKTHIQWKGLCIAFFLMVWSSSCTIFMESAIHDLQSSEGHQATCQHKYFDQPDQNIYAG